MLMDTPYNTYAAHKGRCAFLLKLYTHAGKNAPLARTLFRAERALPLTVPKANSQGSSLRSRRRGYAAPPQSCAFGLARPAAVLPRVAVDLPIGLFRLPDLLP